MPWGLLLLTVISVGKPDSRPLPWNINTLTICQFATWVNHPSILPDTKWTLTLAMNNTKPYEICLEQSKKISEFEMIIKHLTDVCWMKSQNLSHWLSCELYPNQWHLEAAGSPAPDCLIQALLHYSHKQANSLVQTMFNSKPSNQVIKNH